MHVPALRTCRFKWALSTPNLVFRSNDLALSHNNTFSIKFTNHMAHSHQADDMGSLHHRNRRIQIFTCARQRIEASVWGALCTWCLQTKSSIVGYVAVNFDRTRAPTTPPHGPTSAHTWRKSQIAPFHMKTNIFELRSFGTCTAWHHGHPNSNHQKTTRT